MLGETISIALVRDQIRLFPMRMFTCCSWLSCVLPFFLITTIRLVLSPVKYCPSDITVAQFHPWKDIITVSELMQWTYLLTLI